MSYLLPSIILLFYSCVNAFVIVSIDYLEDYGFPWVMIYIVTEWLTASIIFIFSLCYVAFKYHNRYDNNINFFKYYYYSIFPPFSPKYKSCWIIIILRAFTWAIAYVAYTIGTEYMNPGDFLLIQTATSTIGNIIIGYLFFNEKFKYKIIWFGLILCIIGVTFVCQPSFIWQYFSNDYASVTLIGFVICILSGLRRVSTAVIVKYSKTSISEELPWMSFLCLGGIISLIFSTSIFIIASFFYSNNNSIWWYSYNVIKYPDITLSLVSVGILGAITAILITVAYRIGDIGKLGVIVNADIPVSYLAQSIFLNEEVDVFTYIGIVLVFVCIFCIFYAQWKEENEHNNNNNEMFEENNENIDNRNQLQLEDDNTKDNTQDIAFYDWKFGYNERHLEQMRMDIDVMDEHSRLL